MRVVFGGNVEEDKWEILMLKSNFSSPFQSPQFYEFFNTVENFSADVFAIEEEKEYKALVVVTIQKEKGIKGYFSRRGIVYGGPLKLGLKTDYIKYLIEEINRFYIRKVIYLEIRNNFDYSNISAIYKETGWVYERHLNVQLNLTYLNLEKTLLAMKYNRRREIKVSYKEGAIVTEAKNKNEIVLLYENLREMYKERVNVPIPPLDYFISLYESVIGKVFIVMHNEKLIGGAFCFFSKTSINTLYYTGLRDYHKKIFPTHLAIMGVIEFAQNNNIRMVDFMGAGKPDIDYGVRSYKLQFGGNLVEHGRFIKILNPFLYKIGVFGLKVLSRLKQ